MRKRGFTSFEFIVVVATLLILAAVLFPVFQRGSGGGSRRSVCQTNLRQIGVATQQYIQDNNERFPSLQTVQGWRGALMLYVRSNPPFHCPTTRSDTAQAATDYWFNARMSGLQVEVLNAPSLTVMFGDGYSTTDPRVALSQMPKSWRDDENSPAKRHLDGANYAFADGHVKWFRADKISVQSLSGQAENPTFAVK